MPRPLSPAHAAAAGAAFERRVQDDLERAGWFVVRSAGSGGPADLVALLRGEAALLIQCKRDGNLRIREWNLLLAIAQSRGAVPLLAEQRRGGITYWRLTGERQARVSPPREEWTP